MKGKCSVADRRVKGQTAADNTAGSLEGHQLRQGRLIKGRGNSLQASRRNGRTYSVANSSRGSRHQQRGLKICCCARKLTEDWETGGVFIPQGSSGAALHVIWARHGVVNEAAMT